MRRRLVSLSAFWRNNHRQGVGITLTEDFGDLDEVLQIITSNYELMYREAVRESEVAELVSDLFAQLEAIGLADKSKPMPIHNVLLAIGNIWLLEKYAFLRSDEFNGLLLGYAEHS